MEPAFDYRACELKDHCVDYQKQCIDALIARSLHQTCWSIRRLEDLDESEVDGRLTSVLVDSENEMVVSIP